MSVKCVELVNLMTDSLAVRPKTVATRLPTDFVRGANDFQWLRSQALDQVTLDAIDQIEQDERAFIERGVVVTGRKHLKLRLKQGVIYTTRSTGHSVANLFVHIYKLGDHTKLRDFIEGAETILDVGANEGYYTLNMLSHNPKARVICVEPNPIALGFLKKNITANKLRNRVDIVGKALWSSSGKELLSVIPQVTSIGAIGPVASSFINTCPERVERIEVSTMTPKKLFESLNIDNVDIMKMDIEGGEEEVLKALTGFFPRINKIVLEYHSQDIRERVTKLLVANGYRELFHEPDRKDFGDLYFVRDGDL
jgi:FkbM family methyltransferase